MIFAKCESANFADNITTLGETLSGPVAILGFNFLMNIVFFLVYYGIS